MPCFDTREMILYLTRAHRLLRERARNRFGLIAGTLRVIKATKIRLLIIASRREHNSQVLAEPDGARDAAAAAP